MTIRPPRRPQLRFTRLELLNWRNFGRVDLDLSSRVFLLGPNASGKSNLLDAFRFVSELAQPGSGGLQAALRRRDGFAQLRSLFARNPSHIKLAVAVGDDGVSGRWRYEVQINRLPKETFATVIHEAVEVDGLSIKERSRPKGSDPRVWSQTLLEQIDASEPFRDLQEFLASCRYLHVVPQIVRDRGRAKTEGEDPYGGDLLRRMKEMPKKSRQPRLRRIGLALQTAVPQFEALDLEDDGQGVPHLYASYKHWRQRASRQPEGSFSDGTLRLIGLLWSMSERGGPLLLEEPELSLNDAVIGELPRMLERMQRLSGRQVIVTTHSGALLAESGVGLKEVYIIRVRDEGSVIDAVADDKMIEAQVLNGLTLDQAVLPLVRPKGVEALGRVEVAA